jgi:prephenate dehydrogenase
MANGQPSITNSHTNRIAIIGLGLIGGSIALGLKRAGIPGLEIVGTARSRETIQNAKRIKAIDVAAGTPEEAARGARLVVVAVPVLATKDVFEEIAPVLAPDTVVTDAGSTKSNVMRWARELLPQHAHFVGGHPMAGKEQTGIDAADPDLFHDKPWVIVPSVTADESAVRTVVGLAQQLGARPIFMDADEHDSYVAAISHLPLALSSALFSMAFGSAAWPEIAQLASSGFRDTTRLASGSPEMARDIMLSNRENVLHWIDRFQEELSRLRETIARGESADVLEAFARPQLERDNFMLNGPPRREQAGAPVETISFSDMLLGSKLAGHLRKQSQMIKDAEERERKGRR